MTKNEIGLIEKQIREKIRLKSPAGAQESGLTLKKAFKFFDTDGSGDISLAEFSMVMERFGVNLSKRHLLQLFNNYDDDKQGSINYAEFSDVVFGSTTERKSAMVSKKGPDGMMRPGGAAAAA